MLPPLPFIERSEDWKLMGTWVGVCVGSENIEGIRVIL